MACFPKDHLPDHGFAARLDQTLQKRKAGELSSPVCPPPKCRRFIVYHHGLPRNMTHGESRLLAVRAHGQNARRHACPLYLVLDYPPQRIFNCSLLLHHHQELSMWWKEPSKCLLTYKDDYKNAYSRPVSSTFIVIDDRREKQGHPRQGPSARSPTGREDEDQDDAEMTSAAAAAENS